MQDVPLHAPPPPPPPPLMRSRPQPWSDHPHQECNIFLPPSCPRARASCLYARTLGLGWHRTRTVLAVRSSMARDGTSASNDMGREPGTGGGKPGTRDGASGTTGYGKPSTRDGKPQWVHASGTTGCVWQAWHRGR